MAQLVEERKQIEVPKGVGRSGVLLVFQQIIDLPRVQQIEVTPGKIAYFRYRHQEEAESVVGKDLSTLLPSSIIRNRPVGELAPVPEDAAHAVGMLFARASMDGHLPIAFVSGTATKFYVWHRESAGISLPENEELYGLPFLFDVNIPSSVLLLCVSPMRRAALVDTARSYKITIPQRWL